METWQWFLLFILIVFVALFVFGPALSDWTRERRKRDHNGWFDPDCPACQRLAREAEERDR